MNAFTQAIYGKLIQPKSRDDDGRRREFILNVLLLGSLALSTGAFMLLLAEFAINPSADRVQSLVSILATTILLVSLYLTSRKGHYIISAYILVFIFLGLAFRTLSSWGILVPQGVLLLALAVEMASILVSARFGIIVTIVACVGVVVLSALQQNHVLSFDASWMKSPGSLSDGIIFAITLGVIATVSWLSNREIYRFNVTLQEQVAKATERLRAANHNLKSLDKAKDEFLSMASHQLGTPLTAITGYLSMALDDDKSNMTEAQRQYIQYGLEASERMGAMTHDLLNVSRLNAGKFVIRKEQADVNHIIGQQIEQLRPAAERKGLELKFVPDATLPPVIFDISKTTQVIMNLIDNAIYYTEKGSVTVKAEREHDNVAFRVIDTGMGVPVAERSKLFAKFFRAENAKSARPDGTGLGLYLAKRVVEEQGGSIIFESEVGKGSTFGFVLPLGGGK